jgi:hypothetical protein
MFSFATLIFERKKKKERKGILFFKTCTFGQTFKSKLKLTKFASA